MKIKKLGKKFSFNNLNIKQKMLALYFFAFILPLVTITIILTKWINKTIMERQFALAKTSLEQTSSLLTSILTNCEQLGDTLFSTRAVQKALEYQFNSEQEVYKYYTTLSFLPDFSRSNPDVLNFIYYTENQTIIENAYFTRVTDEIKGKSWYKAAVAASGRPIWVIKNSETLDSQTLALVRALFNRTTGTLTGVLALHLDNRKIEQLVNAHKDQTIVLVDGKVAFSSRPFAFKEKLSLSTGLNIGEFKSDNILWGKDRSLTMLYGLYHEYGNSITLAQIIPHKDLESATNFVVLLCVLLMAGGSILSLSLLQIFSRYMAKRVSYLQMQINRIVQNNFELGPRLSGSDEFAEIYDALMATSNNIKTLIDEVYRHKIQREQLLARQNDIRFKMLSNQINPHFLFNSLETIRMQAIEDDNKEVAKTIKLLAKILRHNLSVSNNPVSLKAEIEAVDNYLAIQHLRFADRVKYSIDIHTDISDAVILPLLIQPLVENSFSHGLQDRKIGGLIEISIDTCNGGKVFQISIKDNGCGITKEELSKLKARLATGTVENFSSSIGMVNVNQRIKLFYGQDYGLEIESEIEKGTLVTIKIPAEFNSDGGKNV